MIGADISDAQIVLARRNVPAATFIIADLLDLDFPDAEFDGVTAFYSISHVPREEHLQLFRLIRRWLRPSGVFLASLGVGDLQDWTGEWLGVPMFFSSHSADGNLRLLADARIRRYSRRGGLDARTRGRGNIPLGDLSACVA